MMVKMVVALTTIVNANQRRNNMPMVGKKKFSYTKAGKKKAKAYAKKKGMKMKSKGKY